MSAAAFRNLDRTSMDMCNSSVVDGVFDDLVHFHRTTVEQPLAADRYQPLSAFV
jgi:hypothetical protein